MIMTIKFLDDADLPRIVTVSNEATFRVTGKTDNYLLYSHLDHHLRKEGEPAQVQFFKSSGKELIVKCIDEIYKHLQEGNSSCDLVKIQQEFHELDVE